MINHVRTLLMNRTREGYGRDFPAEEYIPRNFVPRQLPSGLQLVHGTLLGTAPDRLFVNWRMHQIMSLLHATELSPMVLLDDPRVTYLPLDRNPLMHALPALKISQPPGMQHTLYVRGKHDADEQLGRLEQIWNLTILDGDNIEVRRLKDPISQTIYSLELSSGLSQRIPLAGSGLFVQVTAAAPGMSWTVRSTARPAVDISVVLQNAEAILREEGLNQLFPLSSSPEEVSWQRVFRRHHVFAYRAAAMLLAMARCFFKLPQQA